MAISGLQTRISGLADAVERWLEAERDALPLWVPVALGAGVAAWFVLPVRESWLAFMLAALALAGVGLLPGMARRSGRALFWAGLLAATGCGLAWGRATWLDHPVIGRPTVIAIKGEVLRLEERELGEKVRLVLALIDGPVSRARVTMPAENLPEGVARGSVINLRARLVPPPGPVLPGGYDFSRAAWFQQWGATGTALGKVELLSEPSAPGLRHRLSAHVRQQLGGSEGGIAAAFASGDRAGITPEDEEAMRNSGLTHLLSISGLHITAVVAAAMFLALKLMALSPWMALRLPLLVLSAGAGALAGIGYTVLTGAEVPTVRSCIAALLVLGGIALGREAVTLRLVATGALIILLLWPESLMGASFQLSFAAIVAIVAAHEVPAVRHFMKRREEGWGLRVGRLLGGLLLTGIVVEVALAPIALYHFHKSGLYGALANMVAIPLTTFVIMPLEALALLFDAAGAGAPFWWLTGKALALLLGLARWVSAQPGAVAAVPSIPDAAFALIVAGGLWLMLWTTRVRLVGLVGLVLGGVIAFSAPAPDLLVTSEGRHLAVRGEAGGLYLLRDRSGDFVRTALSERAGEIGEPRLFETLPGVRCGPDMCIARIRREGRDWMIGATRSRHFLPWEELTALCPRLDVILSDRKLPSGCTPRWLKLDPPALKATGALAITLGNPPRLEAATGGRSDHPWRSGRDAR
jgi:competence protein ComEC